MANYYQFLCECGHMGFHELERTRVGRGLPWKHGIQQTIYALCVSCDRIYQGTRYGIALENRKDLDSLEGLLRDTTCFVPYNGHLTWDQIIRNAQNCSGRITAADEGKIERAEEIMERIAEQAKKRLKP